jgi:hypothetical protein
MSMLHRLNRRGSQEGLDRLPKSYENSLKELRLIFDEKIYMKNIKSWVKEYDASLYPHLEDVLPIIILENLSDGFNAYVLFALMSEVIKVVKSSERMMKIIEDHIMNIIWSSFKYLQSSWNMSNKKNIEAMFKVTCSLLLNPPFLSLIDVYDGSLFVYGIAREPLKT